jgi:hypothetical protein
MYQVDSVSPYPKKLKKKKGLWDILVFKFMDLEMGLRELVCPYQYLTVQKKLKKCALEESVASSHVAKLAHHKEWQP